MSKGTLPSDSDIILITISLNGGKRLTITLFTIAVLHCMLYHVITYSALNSPSFL